MNKPLLTDDASRVTRDLRMVADFIRQAKNLSAADRTALHALLKELEALVRAANSFDQPHPD